MEINLDRNVKINWSLRHQKGVMNLFGMKVEAKEPEATNPELDKIFSEQLDTNSATQTTKEVTISSSQSSREEGNASTSSPLWSSLFTSSSTSKEGKEESSREQQYTNESESNAEEKQSPAESTNEGWGYDLYPERRGETYKPRWSRVLFGLEGTENLDKIKCERNIYWCVKNSPLVKLMMGALKSSGCPIDIRRHISCEVCDPTVTGGYDPVLNQIVVCQNMARRKGFVQGVLTHEMIHMFDYCNNELDFRNIDHLACTEIRAANLAHCSFLSACAQGDASIINIRKTHENCVKSKALASVLAVRNVTTQEAIDAVERVFPKCYNDLEPIGRRLKRNSQDAYRAYMEGPMYGYDV